MKLTVEYSQSPTRKNLYAYALRLRVTEAEDIPSKIFVYQRSVSPMPDGINHCIDTVDRFIHVATPLDFDEVPEDEPDLSNDIPYYRTDEVVIWFRSLIDLNKTKLDFEDDINTLVRTYESLDNLEVTETKTYGD